MEDAQRIAEEKKRRAKERARIVTYDYEKGISISAGDVEILAFINKFRLLRIEQLELLTGRQYPRVYDCLKKFVDAGYLRRHVLPKQEYIYFLAPRALRFLNSQGHISDEEAERRVRLGDRKSPTLLHDMLIVDFHLAVQFGSMTTPFELLSWEEGESISITFEMGGESTIIRPDALFRIKDSRHMNKRTFVFEADRSSMLTSQRPGSERFMDKVERYMNAILCGQLFQQYEAQAISIVTLTLNEKRRDSLWKATSDFLIKHHHEQLGKYFLFGSREDISFENPSTVFEPMYRRPGQDKPRALFPSLAQSRPSV
jgi:Replication-relaxation